VSGEQTVYVWCDGLDPDGTECVEWTYGGGVPESRTQWARRAAKREGWTCRGTRDLCPKHSRQEQSP